MYYTDLTLSLRILRDRYVQCGWCGYRRRDNGYSVGGGLGGDGDVWGGGRRILHPPPQVMGGWKVVAPWTTQCFPIEPNPLPSHPRCLTYFFPPPLRSVTKNSTPTDEHVSPLCSTPSLLFLPLLLSPVGRFPPGKPCPHSLLSPSRKASPHSSRALYSLFLTYDYVD